MAGEVTLETYVLEFNAKVASNFYELLFVMFFFENGQQVLIIYKNVYKYVYWKDKVQLGEEAYQGLKLYQPHANWEGKIIFFYRAKKVNSKKPPLENDFKFLLQPTTNIRNYSNCEKACTILLFIYAIEESKLQLSIL